MYIFQSEQVIRLQFWLKPRWYLSCQISVHWIITCGCDTWTLYSTEPNNIAELRLPCYDLPQEFTHKAILSFRKRFWFCDAAADKHFEHSV